MFLVPIKVQKSQVSRANKRSTLLENNKFVPYKLEQLLYYSYFKVLKRILLRISAKTTSPFVEES